MTLSRVDDALAVMRERHPLVVDRVKQTHGLLISQQVMLLAAFFRALDTNQRHALRAIGGLQPAGITSLYADGGLERRVKPGLDARLDYRFWCDAPEMLTVMTGDADGLHYAALHDDAKKPPWLFVKAWSRDTAISESTHGLGYTFIETLIGLVNRGKRDGLDARALMPVLEAMGEASTAVSAAEHPKRSKPGNRSKNLSGVGPILPAAFPTWLPPLATRSAAYTDDAAILDEWVSGARTALGEGDVGPALLFGRELTFARNRRADEAAQLQIDAYRHLKRDAMAAIVEVHHAHRALKSVDVFE